MQDLLRGPGEWSTSLTRTVRLRFLWPPLSELFEVKPHLRSVVELSLIPPDAYPACACPSGDSRGEVRDFGNGASQVGEGMRLPGGLYFYRI